MFDSRGLSNSNERKRKLSKKSEAAQKMIQIIDNQSFTWSVRTGLFIKEVKGLITIT
jgi:hypothetical protein